MVSEWVHTSFQLCACTYQSGSHTLAFSVHFLHLEMEDLRLSAFQQGLQMVQIGLVVGCRGTYPNFPYGSLVGSVYLNSN